VVTEIKKDGIIFPNPCDDLLICNDCEHGIYTILDFQGHQYQLIFQQHQSNVSHLIPGMYFLKTGQNVVNFLKK
ncbi:MAG: T9SS type A sorting domain-containing protein, partial [Saprospiraceae bacterium]|nr:T9SS type A sorting domain-containing protein [Saprospiraceae bacterium]